MMKPSLQLKLGQTLTMTPQLQQAIRLLQMPALELQAHIREQLESNVMLEPVDEYEATGSFERSNRTRCRKRSAWMRSRHRKSWSNPKSSKTTGASAAPDLIPGAMTTSEPPKSPTTPPFVAGPSGRPARIRQSRAARAAIARAIVDAINDDGYITDSLEDIAATLFPKSPRTRAKSTACCGWCKPSTPRASPRAP